MLTGHAAHSIASDISVHPDPSVHTGPHVGRFRMTAWCLSPGNAARRARQLLRDRLSRLPIAADLVAELEVVVTELTTNAVRYAPGPYELRVLHDRGLPARVEVADAGAGAALIERLMGRAFVSSDRVDKLAIGGRGLMIVTEFTRGRCGAKWTRLCSTGQLGTSVWFDLPTARRQPYAP